MNPKIAWAKASIVERPTSNRLTTSYGEASEVRLHVIIEIGTEARSPAILIAKWTPGAGAPRQDSHRSP